MSRRRPYMNLCPKCEGHGDYRYGSTATWRKGGMVAGAAMTWDVCDKCWGSGDETNHWTNIRELEAKFKTFSEDQVKQYMHDRFGLYLDSFNYCWVSLAELADKEANRRKIPEGKDEFWFRHTWTSVANILRSWVKP